MMTEAAFVLQYSSLLHDFVFILSSAKLHVVIFLAHNATGTGNNYFILRIKQTCKPVFQASCQVLQALLFHCWHYSWTDSKPVTKKSCLLCVTSLPEDVNAT